LLKKFVGGGRVWGVGCGVWGFTHFQAVNYLCHYAIGKARIVAKERGYNWDTMTEEEKEEFIDNIVHEPS
jgi:hypothetical protein